MSLVSAFAQAAIGRSLGAWATPFAAFPLQMPEKCFSWTLSRCFPFLTAKEGTRMEASARRTTGIHRRWRLHPFLVSIGGTLLIAAFPSDVMYSQTALMEWSNASEWLIAAGLVFALLAAIALVIELLADRARRISWIDFVLLALAALLSLVNAFVHSRDAWTTVEPEGIWLSGLSALLMLIVGVRGWSAMVEPFVREGDRA
jgi:uncharacterized membrane protein